MTVDPGQRQRNRGSRRVVRSQPAPARPLDLLQGDISDLGDLNFRAAGYPGFEHGEIGHIDPWGNLGHETAFTQRGFSPTPVVVPGETPGTNRIIYAAAPGVAPRGALERAEAAAGLTHREADAEAFQQAIRDAAVVSGAGAVPPGQQPGRPAQATPQHGFDLSTIADAMLRPDVNGSLTVKPDGSVTFKSDTNRPDEVGPSGAVDRTESDLFAAADAARRGATTPDPAGDQPGGDPVGGYLDMLHGLGSDEARINFGLEQGIISNNVAASLAGGASINNTDLFTWDGGQIKTLEEVTPVGDGAPAGDPPGPEDDGGDAPGEEPGDDGGGQPEPVFVDEDGAQITFGAAQANVINNAVADRKTLIDQMVAQGLLDIQSAQDLYTQATDQIFTSFLREQGIINRQFKADLEAAGLRRSEDRQAMLENLQRAGIDPGLISAELAEIDAIYGEGSQAQRDYLDNITRIGAMSDVERQLMGMYQFGAARQDLQSQGRALLAEAGLSGIDRLESLALQGNQAAQLAPFFGADQSTLLAGMLSGLDVPGELAAQRQAGVDALAALTADAITPYQQAQLDLAGGKFGLDLFETLNEMSQPTALDIDRQHAANYKSALQKVQNYRPSLLERQLGIDRGPVDLLTADEILALDEFGVTVEDLRKKENNLAAFAEAMEVDLSVLRGAIESGVQGQVIAELIADANDPRVPYLPPGVSGPGLLMPLSEAVKRYGWDYKQPDPVDPDPLTLFGFGVGDSVAGYDVDDVTKIAELMRLNGLDPAPVIGALFATQNQ